MTGRSPAQSEPAFSRLHFYAAVIVFAAVVVLLIPHVQRIPFRFSITYNEGWNLYHSARAAADEPLYSATNQFTPLIYPPFYFHLLGIFHTNSDPLTAGRILAFLSLLLTGAIAAGCVKVLGGNRTGCLLAAAFFCGTVGAFAPQYSGMNDPQLSAQVLTSAGFLFFLTDSARLKNLFLSALLIAAGLFVKHNVISVPITIFVLLLLQSRKRLSIWTSSFAAAIAAFTLLTLIVDGSDFVSQLLSPRLISSSKMISQTRYFGTLMIIPLIVAVLWIRNFRNSKNRHSVHSLGLLLVFSIVTGIFASAGFGTALNMFFEAFFCLAIISGLAVSSNLLNIKRNNGRAIPPSYAAILIFALMGPILWKTAGAAAELFSGKTLGHFRKQQTVFLSDMNFLRSTSGPAICGNLTLCFYAEKPFLFDPFNVSQKILTGGMQEESALQLIRSGKASVIQIKEQRSYEAEQQKETPEMFPDSFFTHNMIVEVRKHYSAERKTATGTFYVRR